ncbi:MAG: hypothetical protein KIT09_20410 [Bryobacteraceae bacterium]|nr:hypothetical protein [Bryobacteraceae bacterium]
MQQERKQESFGSWSLPTHPGGIEHSTQLIEDLAAEARKGHRKFPRGGVEIGGVLFGRREKGGVRILAARPIPCHYAFGPSFALSADEHDALSLMLREYRKDPELKDLVPVGWYHSHTRGELALSDADLHLHNRHFPEPWQVALLFKPDGGKPGHLGVFVKPDKGELPTRPALTVELVGAGVDDATIVITPPAAPAGGVESQASLPQWLNEPPRQPHSAAGRSGKRLALVLLALALVASGVAGLRFAVRAGYADRVYSYWSRVILSEPPSDAGLRLEGTGEELTVRWDATAERLQPIRRAVLTIWDGDRKSETILERKTLLQGSTTYRRSSESVIVRLTAGATRHPLVETARFVGKLPGHGSPTDAENEKKAEALRQEKEQLEVAVQLQARENDVLGERVAALQQMAQAKPVSPPPAAPEPPKPDLAEQKPTEPVAPPPVLLEQRPVAPSSAAAPAGDASPSRAARPVYSGPAVGMLIWTGVLTNGSVLTIQGRQASTGVVSGRLPGRPVRVTAYVAELSSGGLVVFTNDSKHAGAGITESPNAQNSWTQTTYRYAPERARTVELVQRPGENNNWSFLAVRAAGASLSQIVISWELLR